MAQHGSECFRMAQNVREKHARKLCSPWLENRRKHRKVKGGEESLIFIEDACSDMENEEMRISRETRHSEHFLSLIHI